MSQHDAILVVGNSKLTQSVVACLLRAEHPVWLLTNNQPAMQVGIGQHLTHANPGETVHGYMSCSFLSSVPENLSVPMAIVLVEEDPVVKQEAIRNLELVLPTDALIAINTESISLDVLQQNTHQPDRIIGLNWSEPAHKTYFLEIITNDQTNHERVEQFCDHARSYWQKDPYRLRTGLGIRTRMLCALIREAFYLVENGYVTVEDIDRACRNDAGYYLPFAGNFRYMDLMGTYIYGMVMQDLNPELSQAQHIPAFFDQMIAEGSHGMATGQGFYRYTDEEVAERTEQFRQFSYQIQELISRYPYDPVLAPSLPSPLPYVYE